MSEQLSTKRKREEEGMQHPIASDSKEPGKKPRQAVDLTPFWDAIDAQNISALKAFLATHSKIDISETCLERNWDEVHPACTISMEEKYSPLLLAVARGANREIIQLLLDAKTDCNQRGVIEDEGIVTPLSLACSSGDEDLVRMLLEAKADPNPTEKDEIDGEESMSFTSLGRAIKENHVAIMKILLEYKANTDIDENDGFALCYAALLNRRAIVKELLLAKVAVYKSGVEDNTALHIACKQGHLEVVSELLRARADVTFRNDAGETALECASMENQSVLTRMFAARNCMAFFAGFTKKFGNESPLYQAAQSRIFDFHVSRVILEVAGYGAALKSKSKSESESESEEESEAASEEASTTMDMSL